ncbi:unnamed protein product [Moneuplotes crassus]|uniref:Ribosomal RNA-processing protein 8 n=1 Tax=Euplotes crassus TaxID=5936 RepID=A0AAD1XT62_EUPCR|nr:unnamed protein product [Moneuplotes crassus]
MDKSVSESITDIMKRQPTQKPHEEQKRAKKRKRTEKKLRPAEVELKSSRFRWLNELLYTSDSKSSFQYFKDNEGCFQDYHDGFKNQVKKWPKNPVDIFITELKKEKYSSKVIADLGCGEGNLELEIKKHDPNREIYSYDIGKINEHVIQADIAHLPLEDNSVDIAIFSLSLMSTNFLDHLLEANRILKVDGLLFVAEVSSRLEINKFVSLLHKFGFKKKKVGQIKTFFYVKTFKSLKANKKKVKKVLKETNPDDYLTPCKYKKR